MILSRSHGAGAGAGGSRTKTRNRRTISFSLVQIVEIVCSGRAKGDETSGCSKRTKRDIVEIPQHHTCKDVAM